MPKDLPRKILTGAAVALVLWVGLQFLFPLLLPFLMGGLLALAAEPAVHLSQRWLRLRRGAAAGLGVGMTLLLLVGVLYLLAAIVFKELAQAAQGLPDVGMAVQDGMHILEDWLVNLAAGMPEGIAPSAQKLVTDTFRDGSTLVGQVTGRIPSAMANLLSWVSESALTLGTGVLAGFMISIRLPRIKTFFKEKLPPWWYSHGLPGIKGMKKTLGMWLRAQGKLIAITWGILTVGFLILGIPFGIFWAALIALVDAVPVLGTGTVLIPWSIVCFLQGNTWQGIGLAVIQAAAWLARTVLEPRVVGHHLDLDPLVTLGAFYAGFRLWGIPGMILAPMLAAAVKGIVSGVQK